MTHLSAALRTAVVAAALGLSAGLAAAQAVPLSFQASPEVYKVVAESPTQRVIEVTWAPGQRDLPHGHPAAAVYFVTDCSLRFFLPDGSTRDGEPKAGYAVIQGPVASHAVQNVGKAACKLVMFEPK